MGSIDNHIRSVQISPINVSMPRAECRRDHTNISPFGSIGSSNPSTYSTCSPTCSFFAAFPSIFVPDNGPEFFAKAVQQWIAASARGLRPHWPRGRLRVQTISPGHGPEGYNELTFKLEPSVGADQRAVRIPVSVDPAARASACTFSSSLHRRRTSRCAGASRRRRVP